MEEVLKILGAIATLFALYKIIVDVILARSSKHREEYQFAKDYLLDLANENVHPFVLEKGFRALTGDSYSVKEIKHLLSYSTPTKAINCRALTEGFIVFKTDSSTYEWCGIYKYKIFQKNARGLYLICYVVFASLAIKPVFFNGAERLIELSNIVYCISMAIIGIICLSKYIDFKYAKELIELR